MEGRRAAGLGSRKRPAGTERIVARRKRAIGVLLCQAAVTDSLRDPAIEACGERGCWRLRRSSTCSSGSAAEREQRSRWAVEPGTLTPVSNARTLDGPVGLLGAGYIGHLFAQQFALAGYEVRAWSPGTSARTLHDRLRQSVSALVKPVGGAQVYSRSVRPSRRRGHPGWGKHSTARG
jgi:hypothetical protein